MKKIFILIFSMVMAGEMTVDGDLTVTGTIQNDSLAQVILLQQEQISALETLIAQLQAQIALLESQMTFLGQDLNNADCFGVVGGLAVVDDCGICDGSNESMDFCGTCGGEAESEDECEINYTLSFDGLDDYVEINNISYLGDFTISGVFSTSETPQNDGRLIDQDGGNDQDYICISIYGNKLNAIIRKNSIFSVSLLSETVVTDGIFHTFAFIREQDSLYLYLDEVKEVATGMATFPFINSTPTWFGCTRWAGSIQHRYSGIIDQIKIINSAVLPQNGSYYISNELQEDIIGLWNFNEGTGLILNDISGNGNHGTIHGNPEWVEH